MYNFRRLRDCVVTNKTVIVRVDFNVPINNGKITDDSRIRAAIPTLNYLIKQDAKVIIISHLGRPKGKVIEDLSLEKLVPAINNLLGGIDVKFASDCVGKEAEKAVKSIKYGEIVLLENLRFHKEEEENSPEFARQLASLANLYVNEAFSCSHREHASIVGITQILKGCGGFAFENEIENIEKYALNAARPALAIIGGVKVSTKLPLLNSLVERADKIVLAGGIANTFLYAKGHNIGKSLYEDSMKDEVLSIYEKAEKHNCSIVLPKDVVVCDKLADDAETKNVDVAKVSSDEIIADVGMSSISEITKDLENYKTVLWNGPLGVIENEKFKNGSIAVSKVIASLTKKQKMISVAGGGNTVSFINSIGLADNFTYISMAGGAFLKFLEGKGLVGIDAILLPDIQISL